MDDPVSVLRPQGEAAPVILDSPHSGSVYPADFDSHVERLFLRRSEDAFVDELFAAAPARGAVLIAARFPRAYVDPNRAEDDIDPAIVADGWRAAANPTIKSRRGSGLVWTSMHGAETLYRRRLTRAEIERRIERCWRPYHAAMREAFDRLHGRFGGVYHLNCHSMRSQANMAEPDEARERPDFVLGDRDGSTCEQAFTELVRDELEARGYSVALNHPFKGVELVKRYSDPAAGRHSLQIEVNRKLYMDEDRIEKHGGFAGLKADMDALIAAIVDHARARGG